MKFPTTCEEFLTTLKAKSKVEGRQQKSKSESCDSFNYEEALKVLGEKSRKSAYFFSLEFHVLKQVGGSK